MKKVCTVLLLALVCLCAAFADTYYVKDLDVNVVLQKNAVLQIKEDYVFNFLTPHHGVYREIPYRYENVHAKIDNLVCSQEYSSYTEDGDLVLKIGSEDKQIIGEWPLEISYSYDMGEDQNIGYDEVYYNIVSDASVDYDNVYFTFVIPDKIDQSKINVTAGSYGSSERGRYAVDYENGNTVIRGYVEHLRDDCSITVYAELPDNWYVGARQMWDLRDRFETINIVFSIALAALAAVMWIFYGRDNIPIISAKFNPPENFSPLLVGYLADESVDDKDITSMLYYWADKGYLRINEKRKNKFTFTKLKDIDEDAPEHEQYLFRNFFRGGETVGMSDLQRTNFFETMNITRVNVMKFFKGERKLYYTKSTLLSFLAIIMSFVPFVTLGCAAGLCEIVNDEIFAIIPLAMFAVLIPRLLFYVLFRKWYIRKSNFLGCVLCCLPSLFVFACCMGICADVRGYAYIPGIFVSVFSSLVMVLFASIMRKRTMYGDKVLEGTLGYREFIDKVSLGELTTMIDEDPMYYYHNLSYAIVLGLEDKWAKKFKDLVVPPPTWYYGVSPFDVYFYSRMASRMTMQIKQNAMPKTTSKTTHVSGFGGGFAGGGFGGGSVHAW